MDIADIPSNRSLAKPDMDQSIQVHSSQALFDYQRAVIYSRSSSRKACLTKVPASESRFWSPLVVITGI